MVQSVRLASAHIAIGAQTSAYEAGINRAIAANQRLVRSYGASGRELRRNAVFIEQFGASVGRAALQIGLYSTAIAGVSLVTRGLVGSFVEFDRNLIAVGKTTGIAEQQLQRLGTQLVRINTIGSNGVGALDVTRRDLFNIGEAVGQAGVNEARAIQVVTQAAAALQSSSNLIGRDAVRSLTRYINVTNQSIDRVNALASAFTNLGNNATATEAEIAAFATQVAQSIASVGGATDQLILGLSTSLVELGIPLERATGVFNRAFAAFGELSADPSFFRVLGQSVGDSAEEFENLRLRMAAGIATAEDYDRTFIAFLRTIRRLPNAPTDELPSLRQFLGGTVGSGENNIRITAVLGTLARVLDSTLIPNIELANEGLEEQDFHFREALEAAQGYGAQLSIIGRQIEEQQRIVGSFFVPALVAVAENFRLIEVAAAGVGVALGSRAIARGISSFRNESQLLRREFLVSRENVVAYSNAYDTAVNRQIAAQRAVESARAGGVVLAGGGVLRPRDAQGRFQRLQPRDPTTQELRELRNANRGVARAQNNLAIATGATADAQARMTARTLSLRNAMRRLGTGLLAFTGGPVGALVTGLTVAAGLFFTFRQNADEAAEAAQTLTERVNSTLTALSRTDTGPAAALRADLQEALAAQNVLIADLEARSARAAQFPRAPLQRGDILSDELAAARERRQELIDQLNEVDRAIQARTATQQEADRIVAASIQSVTDAYARQIQAIQAAENARRADLAEQIEQNRLRASLADRDADARTTAQSLAVSAERTRRRRAEAEAAQELADIEDQLAENRRVQEAIAQQVISTVPTGPLADELNNRLEDLDRQAERLRRAEGEAQAALERQSQDVRDFRQGSDAFNQIIEAANAEVDAQEAQARAEIRRNRRVSAARRLVEAANADVTRSLTELHNAYRDYNASQDQSLSNERQLAAQRERIATRNLGVDQPSRDQIIRDRADIAFLERELELVNRVEEANRDLENARARQGEGLQRFEQASQRLTDLGDLGISIDDPQFVAQQAIVDSIRDENDERERSIRILQTVQRLREIDLGEFLPEDSEERTAILETIAAVVDAALAEDRLDRSRTQAAEATRRTVDAEIERVRNLNATQQAERNAADSAQELQRRRAQANRDDQRLADARLRATSLGGVEGQVEVERERRQIALDNAAEEAERRRTAAVRERSQLLEQINAEIEAARVAELEGDQDLADAFRARADALDAQVPAIYTNIRALRILEEAAIAAADAGPDVEAIRERFRTAAEAIRAEEALEERRRLAADRTARIIQRSNTDVADSYREAQVALEDTVRREEQARRQRISELNLQARLTGLQARSDDPQAQRTALTAQLTSEATVRAQERLANANGRVNELVARRATLQARLDRLLAARAEPRYINEVEQDLFDLEAPITAALAQVILLQQALEDGPDASGIQEEVEALLALARARRGVDAAGERRGVAEREAAEAQVRQRQNLEAIAAAQREIATNAERARDARRREAAQSAELSRLELRLLQSRRPQEGEFGRDAELAIRREEFRLSNNLAAAIQERGDAERDLTNLQTRLSGLRIDILEQERRGQDDLATATLARLRDEQAGLQDAQERAARAQATARQAQTDFDIGVDATSIREAYRLAAAIRAELNEIAAEERVANDELVRSLERVEQSYRDVQLAADFASAERRQALADELAQARAENELVREGVRLDSVRGRAELRVLRETQAAQAELRQARQDEEVTLARIAAAQSRLTRLTELRDAAGEIETGGIAWQFYAGQVDQAQTDVDNLTASLPALAIAIAAATAAADEAASPERLEFLRELFSILADTERRSQGIDFAEQGRLRAQQLLDAQREQITQTRRNAEIEAQVRSAANAREAAGIRAQLDVLEEFQRAIRQAEADVRNGVDGAAQYLQALQDLQQEFLNTAQLAGDTARQNFQNPFQDALNSIETFDIALANVAVNGITSLETALVNMFQTGTLGFKELATAVASDLLRALIRAVITANILRSILSFAGTPFNVAPGAFGVPNIPTFHSGGLPGYGGTPRGLNAGLRSDELFAVLQRGEIVVPRHLSRRARYGGAAGIDELRRWIASLPRFHEGGVAGSRGGSGGMGLAGIREVKFEFINETGTPLEGAMSDDGFRIDGERLIIGAVVRNIQKNGVIPQTMRRVIGRR